MPSESGDRRPARQQQGGVHPPEPEHLPCPRCDSTNTKFCYYNNYNLSQPRHFCKGCRRYWTRGGTLRNVPVGGGTRKNTPNKRARNGATPTTSSSSLTCDPVHPNPGSIIAGFKTETTTSFCADMNLNENVHESENFTSLLNQGGFGFGIGSGYREIGFGLGAGVWQMEEAGGANGGSAISTPGCNTWQMGSVEGGMAEGECFGWPDLAISTPGWGPK